MMTVVANGEQQVGTLAAAEVASALAKQPAAAIGVATGSSPLSLYRSLANLVRAGRLDMSGRTAFALDEYVGLPPEHPESYHSVIARNVTRPLRLVPENVHVPTGTTQDLAAAARAYEQAVRSFPTRVQIIGIGSNGHIGFNEPGSQRSSQTRVVALSDETRAANSRFFPDLATVPTHAVTQGISTILHASTIVLVAHGATKAAAIAAALEGAESEAVPASLLQSHHDVRVFLDRAAAQRLRNHSPHTIPNRPPSNPKAEQR